MAYSPPQTLSFDFSAATSGTLSFDFLPLNVTQTIDGIGTDVSLFGEAAQVANVAQGVTTSGGVFSVYGQPFVDIPGPQQTTVPVGINAPPFGTAALGNVVRGEFGPPLPAPAYGTALHFQFTLPLAEQQVYPLGLLSQEFGTAETEYSPFIYPVGTDMSLYGTTFVANKSDLLQTVTGVGFDATEYGNKAAVGRALRFKFGLPDYVAPTPLIEFDFVTQGGPQNIFFLGSDYSELGSPTVDFYVRYVYPTGASDGAVGTPATSRFVATTGFTSTQVGTPYVLGGAGGAQLVSPTGSDTSALGAVVFTARIRVAGINDSAFGTVSISPQFVRPTGWTGAIGSVTFDQTLTTRTVTPSGFSSYALGTVKVDPRFIYTPGFRATGDQARFGNSRVQLATLYPLAIPPGDFGVARVDDGKQFVTTTGIAPPHVELPQPEVIGRWEYIYPPSVAEAGVFGDTGVRLKLRVVAPPGFDASAFADFAPLVLNRNRVVAPFGWLSPGAFYARPYVYNYAWQIIPVGDIGPETFGAETDVGFFLKYVYPQPIDSAVFGTAAVVNAARQIDLADRGITGEFGTAMVASGVREVRPVGSSFGTTGVDHFVDYGLRKLQDAGGIFAFLPSTGTVVESTVRYIDHGTYGEDMSSFGAPTTWFRIRDVAPPSIAYQFTWLQFGGEVRVEYSLKYITGIGWESSRFGTTSVRRNEFVVQPPSIVGGIGQPDVQWRRRFVAARTIGDATEYGTAWLYYNPRYVYQYFDENALALVGGVGVPRDVANRNRTIATYGWRSSRFSSGNFVYNNARVVEMEGADQALYGTAFVADRVRSITTIGHESSFFQQWNAVYNYSRRIEPSGIPRLYVGVPYVWSNTQWVDLYGSDNEHTEWGTQFVAYRIRTVSLDLQPGALFSDGIPPPPYNVPLTHYVGLFRQHVDPSGSLFIRFGAPVFEEKFSIVKPWGNYMSLYGEGAVRNLTPEIKPLGWQEFDIVWTHYVGLYTRTVNVERQSIPPPHEFLPRPVVEFRTKRVTVPGINSLRIPLLHDVRFDAPEIPVPQRVFVSSVPSQSPNNEAAAYGNAFVRRMPSPEGWLSSRFGTHWVRVQGCVTLWDWPSSTFGTPSLNPPLTVPVQSFGADAHGKPRITPHTVYCTSDAPQQYKNNHGPLYWSDIDMITGVRDPNVQWGNAVVSLKTNRTVYHFHRSGTPSDPDFTIGEKFGELETSNWIRQIFPDGVPPKLVGIPDLPTLGELFVTPFASSVFGSPTVALDAPPATNRTVHAAGTSMAAFGATYVELFNRTIFPVGSRMDVYGNNNPMVHFPRKIQNTGGLDATGWGDNWVSFKDRVIFPIGHDSFIMDYELQYFNDRLKVYKATHPVFLTGGDFAQFGTAEAKLKAQYVKPYQIAAPKCLGHDVAVVEV